MVWVFKSFFCKNAFRNQKLPLDLFNLWALENSMSILWTTLNCPYGDNAVWDKSNIKMHLVQNLSIHTKIQADICVLLATTTYQAKKT